jgi:hypothetical protein
MRALQVVGGLLGRHFASDLAHRRQQRQVAVRELYCLVRDRYGARLHQYPGQRRLRGKVKVGIEDEPGTQVPVLLRQRLLHLHHHLTTPHLGRVAGDASPAALIFAVGEPAALTGAHLDQNLVPCPGQLDDPRRSDPDPVFLVFPLPWNPDSHIRLPRRIPIRVILFHPGRRVPGSRANRQDFSARPANSLIDSIRSLDPARFGDPFVHQRGR